MKKNNILGTIKAIGILAINVFILLILPDLLNSDNSDSELIQSFLIKLPIAIVIAQALYLIFMLIFMRIHMGKYRKFIKETKNGGLMSDNTKQEMHSAYNKAIAENDLKTANDIIVLLAEYYKNHGEAQLALQLLKGYNEAYYAVDNKNITSRYSLANYYCIYLHTLLILDNIDEADRIYGLSSALLIEFLHEGNDIEYNIRIALTEYYFNKHDGEKALVLLDGCSNKLRKKHGSNIALLRAAALAELRRFDEAEALLNGIQHKNKEYLEKQISEIKCGNIQHIYDDTERNQTNEPLT